MDGRGLVLFTSLEDCRNKVDICLQFPLALNSVVQASMTWPLPTKMKSPIGAIVDG